MKQILAAALLFISLSACNGADNTGSNQLDNSCDFDARTILNGPNRQGITSEWDCLGSEGFTTIALFDDGSGVTLVGNDANIEADLTWNGLACRSLAYSGQDPTNGALLAGVATQITGSTASKKLTFVHHSNGVDQEVTCILTEK